MLLQNTKNNIFKYTLFLVTFLLVGQMTFSQTIKEIKPEWKKCNISQECVLIPYGCVGIESANKRYQKEAEKTAWKIGGDPRAIDCTLPYKATIIDQHVKTYNV